MLVTEPALAADSSGCININTAPKEELVKIKQIGEARAEQIINMRKEKLFSSVDDLDRVVGIGPSRIADIKEQGLACVEDGPPLLPQTATELKSPAVTSKPPIKKTIAPEKELAAVGEIIDLSQNEKAPGDHGTSLLLPIAIFTSFSVGVMILLLKKKLHVGPQSRKNS